MSDFQKTGPHCIVASSDALAWARQSPIVKAVNDTRPLRVARPDAIKIFRKFFPHQDLTRHGGGVVNDVLQSLGDAPCDFIELYNETAQHGYEGLDRYITFHAEAVAYLESIRHTLPTQQQYIQILGYSFSTGCPEQADWELLRRRRYGGVRAIGMHCYWGRRGFTPWHALRYRQAHEWTEGDHPPFIITECGIDRIEDGYPGWKLVPNMTGQQYLDQLKGYDAELCKDAYVIGATPFTAGPTSDWNSFETDGLVGMMRLSPPAPALSIPDYPPPVEQDQVEQEEGTMPIAAFWLSHSDYPQVRTIDEACDRAIAQTPPGHKPCIVWPATYSVWWQAECRQNLGPLAPRDPAHLAEIKAAVNARGVEFWAWCVVRFANGDEGLVFRQVAQVAEQVVLDVEPKNYGPYLTADNLNPDGMYQAIWQDDDPGRFKTWLCVAPVASGIDPLGDAWLNWLRGTNGVMPMCYWNANQDLHPDIALPYLVERMRAVGFESADDRDAYPIIPIVPSPADTGDYVPYMAAQSGDVAVWRLVPAEVSWPALQPEPEADYEQMYIAAIVRAEQAEAERDEALARLANIKAAGGW